MNVAFGSILAAGSWPRKRPESLRVFGCCQTRARGGARRQASEKPRGRKPRGEIAPPLMSIYGDLPPVLDVICRFQTGRRVE